jgi:hypothetical protein
MELAIPRTIIVDDLARSIITLAHVHGPFQLGRTPIHDKGLESYYLALAELDKRTLDDEYRTQITQEALRRFGLALAFTSL